MYSSENGGFRWKRWLVLPFLGLVATLVVACGSDDSGSTTTVADDCKTEFEFPTIEDGKLTAVAEEYPPFMTFAGDEPSGVDADVLKRVAEELCLELDLKEVQQAAVIPSVETKRADIAGGTWYRTKDRAQVVNQSYPIYLDSPALVSREGYANTQDVLGKSIGTVQGNLWVEEMQDLYGDDLKLYQSWDQLWTDLKNGRIEVAMGAAAQAGQSIAQEETDLQVVVAEPDPAIASTVRPGQANLPHTKGNDEMTEAVDAVMRQLHEDGEITEILEQYDIDPAIGEVGRPYDL